ncbi:MAG: hypothetical protein AB7S38_20060 [Vulcanimicrobiota bacterium]
MRRTTCHANFRAEVWLGPPAAAWCEAVLGSSNSVIFLRGPELSAYGRTVRAGQPRAAMTAFLGEPEQATGDTLTFDNLVKADLAGDRLAAFRLGLHPSEYTPCDRAAF